MTEPLRIDELGADDRLLDALAARTYDGADPIGGLLLSLSLIHISEPTRPY